MIWLHDLIIANLSIPMQDGMLLINYLLVFFCCSTPSRAQKKSRQALKHKSTHRIRGLGLPLLELGDEAELGGQHVHGIREVQLAFRGPHEAGGPRGADDEQRREREAGEGHHALCIGEGRRFLRSRGGGCPASWQQEAGDTTRTIERNTTQKCKKKQSRKPQKNPNCM